MSNEKPAAESLPLISLTPTEIQRLVKPHTGFEDYTQELVALYESRADALGRGKLDGRSLLQMLAAYRDLYQVEAAARAHLDRVRQTRLKYASTVWAGMLEIYARATSAARSDGDIRHAIARFARFMKHAPRKKAVSP